MGRPARLLYVTLTMEFGGAERQLSELLRLLDRTKFSPHLCCLQGRGPLLEDLAPLAIPTTILQEHRPVPLSRLRAFGVFFAQLFTLARLMRDIRPDIVHAVLPMACVTAGFAACLARAPLLVTTRRCLGYYKEEHFILSQVENMVNCRADAVVANSEAVRADTIARERIDPAKLSVIYNGVGGPEDRAPQGWRTVAGRDIGGPVVCCVANFFPYKGHLDLVAAAARVIKNMPAATFVLVGEGSMRAMIERAADARGLGENIVFMGSRPDSREIMRLSDLIVLASHQEGFPNVLLEAMAAGRPVVATRVGGVPEIVQDGVTGMLVPPGDPERLAAAILHVLSDGERARAMGRRGLELVRERFSLEAMVRSYERLYERLLAKEGIW